MNINNDHLLNWCLEQPLSDNDVSVAYDGPDDWYSVSWIRPYGDGGKHTHWHQIGGPALVRHRNGRCDWYVFGSRFFTVKAYISACKMSEQDALLFLMKWGLSMGAHLPEYITHDGVKIVKLDHI